MQALVVFYSRTGHTRGLAQRIAAAAGAEIEEIADRVDRRGILGYLRSGRDAWLGRRAEIVPPAKDPGNFDVVLIGTPVWNMSLSSPVRSYLEGQAARLARVAFFCTLGGSGAARVFRQMQQACGKAPLATLARTERQLSQADLPQAVEQFAARIRALD
jgi:flavodoxin